MDRQREIPGPHDGLRHPAMWRLLATAALALSAVTGCKTVEPADPTHDPAISEGTRNEREAEATVRKALACYAAWDLDGAYNLICSRDRAKMSLAEFKAGSLRNREELIRTAQDSEVVQSGESTLPDGTPYVTVIVRVARGEVMPYSVIREPAGWRLILVDPRRARQAFQ